MDGMTRRSSPFSPFSEIVGVSEILRSPYRGEEVSGGAFPERHLPNQVTSASSAVQEAL